MASPGEGVDCFFDSRRDFLIPGFCKPAVTQMTQEHKWGNELVKNNSGTLSSSPSLGEELPVK